MEYIIGTCSHCGEHKKVVKSSNPLAKELCASCIAEIINMEKAEEIANLSKTLRIPFDLNEYYTLLLGNPNKEEVMEDYLEHLAEGRFHDSYSLFDWDKIDEHFNKSKNYAIALAQIEPLKQLINQRGEAKWGPGFTFQEYINMEALYENTIKQFGIESEIQKDGVRKAIRVSSAIDSLIQVGNFKDVKEATVSYKSFLETASIKDLVAISSDDTIRTVADLVLMIEKLGYEFNRLQPDVPKDEIDFLMDRYTEKVKEIVSSSTGLEVQLRDMIESQKRVIEEKTMKEVSETYTLEDDIDDDYLDEEEKKFVNELEIEEVGDDDFQDLYD